MTAVALVGARGAGKSTVGPLVARALGRRFVDLDVEVERLAGAPAREVFARQGEAAYRALEARALRAALDADPAAVVALGGGAVTHEPCRELLRARARVVHLAAPAEVLAARVEADPRSHALRPPLRPGGPLAEARALLAERDPLYRALAEVVVDARGSVDEVVRAIVAALAG